MSDETRVVSEALPARLQPASVYAPGGESQIVARFASKVRGLKEQLKALSTERDGFKTAVAQLTGERDTLRIKADTSLTAKEVDRLRGELRMHKHRQAFDALGRAAGIRPDALADAWELAKYQPETDEPDEPALGELVAGLKANKAYLFGGEAGVTSEGGPPASPGPKPAVGSGRGTPNGHGAPAFSKDLAQTDVAYVMKNYDAYVAAAKAGTLK